ncbi:MAG: ribonuclease VapC [Herpetosiphonaceae bacterium]|nr:MAG: ribonuclease VapC [Herpetosiphonaceae bacterium]
MRYLLDTCIISELITKKPNQKVVTWIDSIDPDTAYLSVITIGEIQKGIAKLSDSVRRSRIEEWLHDELLIRFTGRIIPLDLPVLLEWGNLRGALEQTGRKMAAMDSLIAASARYHKLQLATRNEDDFQYAGIPIINPWKEA